MYCISVVLTSGECELEVTTLITCGCGCVLLVILLKFRIVLEDCYYHIVLYGKESIIIQICIKSRARNNIDMTVSS